MKWKRILIVVVISFFFQDCSIFKSMEMSAVLSPEQQEGYMETIISQKKHFVSLAPYREYNPAHSNTAFILFIKNFGEIPIDISTQNISAEFFGNTNKWASRDITILSPDKLMNDLKRKQFDYEMVAHSATSTYTYYTYDEYGNIIATWTGTKCEPAYYTAIDSYNKTGRQMQMVEELVFHPLTLQPGEGGGGLVVCDTSTMNSKVEGNFHLIVSVNGEQHEFTFSRSSHE